MIYFFVYIDTASHAFYHIRAPIWIFSLGVIRRKQNMAFNRDKNLLFTSWKKNTEFSFAYEMIV